MSLQPTTPHAIDATAENFEAEVLDRSLQVPVLIDFWAEWCGPCKTVGPVLEKLAAEYNGAFVLARIDVDSQQQLAGAFQIRSIPTIILVKDGQPVDGFPGAMPEGELRSFLAGHGIVPAEAPALEDEVEAAPPVPVDPQAEVARLRQEAGAAPDDDNLKLDLAVALLATGATDEAGRLLDALPANLATDDRALRARAALGFAAVLHDAPQAACSRRRWPRIPATCGHATSWVRSTWWPAGTRTRCASSWRCCAATAASRTACRARP